MKKAALTIGLFSLAMVATSFTTENTTLNSGKIITTLGIDGELKVGINTKLDDMEPIDGKGSVGGGRKQDPFAGQELQIKNSQSNFSNINQSVGVNRKID